jgi:hypothetical protein
VPGNYRGITRVLLVRKNARDADSSLILRSSNELLVTTPTINFFRDKETHMNRKTLLALALASLIAAPMSAVHAQEAPAPETEKPELIADGDQKDSTKPELIADGDQKDSTKPELIA